MSIRTFCAIAIAAMLSSPAHAVYKCTTDDRVVYQDTPCSNGTGTLVNIAIAQGSETTPTITPKPRSRAEPVVMGDGLVAVPVSIKIPDKAKDPSSGTAYAIWPSNTPSVPARTP